MNNHKLLTRVIVGGLILCNVTGYGQSREVKTLEELFEIAEANSSQLRQYLTAEEEARQQVKVSENGRLPDINATLSLSYIGDGFTTDRRLGDYQRAPIPHFGSGLSVGVTQPVYTGGAVSGAIELAELKSTAARYASELQRDNIRFQLAGYYLDIYKYGNLRTVVENNIEQARKVLAEMEARHKEGVALQNDITRYELLVSNLELQLTKINNLLDILHNNLRVVCGLPQGTIINPDPAIIDQVLPRQSESNWQDEAATNAPALKLADAGVAISRKAEKLARSERLPKIGVQAGWTIDGPILVEVPPINRNLSYWYVGVGVSYNLSSLYKSNKSIAKSKIATRKAIDELEAIRDNVGMRIRADYVRYLEAYEELKTHTKSVELAERNYRTTSVRYSADMVLITDMLDAANSKLDAEQQLVNARINIIYYYYKLLFTSGKI